MSASFRAARSGDLRAANRHYGRRLGRPTRWQWFRAHLPRLSWR